MVFYRRPGLYPLVKGYSNHRLFGFDVETHNENADLTCVSIVGQNLDKTFYHQDDFKHFIATNKSLFKGSYIAATNLTFDIFAVFKDWGGILECCDIIERNASTILARTHAPYSPDGKLYRLSGLNKELNPSDNYYPITFIDSTNHYMTSVENLGRVIGINKLSKPDFLGNEPKTLSQWTELVKYNKQDALITYKFMNWLQDMYNSIGCELKPTISGTALNLFRRKYLDFPIYQQKRDCILDSYKSYYGGRTECFKRGHFNIDNYGMIKSYDVNSLYPFTMKTNLYPIPADYYREPGPFNFDEVSHMIGTAHFVLKVPDDMNIPILPMNTDKLRFPAGIIEGYYDFPSVRYAQQKGYIVIKSDDGIIYNNTFKPFKSFVDDLYSLRQRLKAEKNPAELIPKILLNSLYGRFAYRFNNKEQIITKDQAMYDMFNTKGYDFIPVQTKFNVRTLADCTDDFYRKITTSESKIPPYVMPIFSILTTAYARIHMHKLMTQIGHDRILYTDTDSIFTTRKIETGSELGELKLEKEFSEIIFVKPKMYGGRTIEGKEYIRIKGLSRLKDDFDDLLTQCKKGQFISDSKLFMKPRGSMHRDMHVNQPYTLHKTLELDDNKRIWDKEHFTLEPQNSNPMVVSKY